ncbi:GntR family transcriptional regulator [Breoghania corrubedonensis]|uniref:GntR family transcriptional regulator n=1 Tax=Breoghania corrubedonensis TaxID=665038 RepID=A0A2T5V5D6_9HYPH|nr:GntR family transcriptional regulator [Breoghania corrubedonensis]PTW58982.1 GntR family transcriptional regulator [Breoghania corrubedonensis]
MLKRPLKQRMTGLLSNAGRGKPKAELAYDFLRDAVITMKLPPDATLAEKELCAELGISRTPLREAVLRLAHEGLLTIVPGGGTYVNKISLRGVLQGHLVRSSIEFRIVRLAARAYNPEHDRDFDLLLYLQEEANRRGDYDQALRVDTDFHRLLCRVAGFPDIWQIVHNATGQLDRVRYRAFDKSGMTQEIVVEHRALYDALRAKDGNRAHALLRKHLDDISHIIDFVRASAPEALLQEDDLDLEGLLASSG